MSTMLKLINIIKNKNIIEADYVPEQSDKKAHVSLNMVTNEFNYDVIDEYGTMYARMALNGLRRTLEEFNKGKINNIPKERAVMWY